jgi:hypothetical protein
MEDGTVLDNTIFGFVLTYCFMDHHVINADVKRFRKLIFHFLTACIKLSL